MTRVKYLLVNFALIGAGLFGIASILGAFALIGWAIGVFPL